MVAVARRRGSRLPQGAAGFGQEQAEEAWRILAAGIEDYDGLLAEFRSIAGLWVEMIQHPGPLNVERIGAFSDRLQRLAQRGLSRDERRRLEELTGLDLMDRATARRQGRALSDSVNTGTV